MSDSQQHVCKLPIEGRNSMCIVKTEWNENSCTMYLLLGNEVWIGSVRMHLSKSSVRKRDVKITK